MTDAVKVYFDTMVFFNKFQDPYKVSPETSNIFKKVKSGEFRLVISQSILMEIFHVMCLPIEKILKFSEAQEAMSDITDAFKDIKETMLKFPNTELAENEFDGISSTNLMDFVESVPGSSLIDFAGKKLPGSMDFMQLMVSSNLKCKKFFTYDNGILMLNSNHRKNDMEIIRPYRG